MVLKLYGPPGSTATRRVAAILVEKQVPFELVVVDLAKGENKLPAFLEKQPFGQVPVIDDDGFILYESRAIGRYIAEKYANQGTPNLVPVGDSDLKAKALFEQAASIEVNNFEPFAAGAFREVVGKKRRGLTPDQAVFDNFINTLAAKLDGYEAILSKQRFLAGDHITLADLFHLPFGTGLALAGSDLLESPEKRPNVARWWKEVSTRPSWLAVKDGAKSTA